MEEVSFRKRQLEEILRLVSPASPIARPRFSRSPLSPRAGWRG